MHISIKRIFFVIGCCFVFSSLWAKSINHSKHSAYDSSRLNRIEMLRRQLSEKLGIPYSPSRVGKRMMFDMMADCPKCSAGMSCLMCNTKKRELNECKVCRSGKYCTMCNSKKQSNTICKVCAAGKYCTMCTKTVKNKNMCKTCAEGKYCLGCAKKSRMRSIRKNPA